MVFPRCSLLFGSPLHTPNVKFIFVGISFFANAIQFDSFWFLDTKFNGLKIQKSRIMVLSQPWHEASWGNASSWMFRYWGKKTCMANACQTIVRVPKEECSPVSSAPLSSVTTSTDDDSSVPKLNLKKIWKLPHQLQTQRNNHRILKLRVQEAHFSAHGGKSNT
jgi:hypothetical protein